MQRVPPNLLGARISTYMTKLVYAVFDDITRGWNGDVRCNPDEYQSYTNLCRPAATRIPKMKPRFSVNIGVKQFMSFFINSLVTEVNNTELADSDTINSLAAKITDANADTYGVFMIDVTSRHVDRFGATLVRACDNTGWFAAHITAAITNKQAPGVNNMVIKIFDDYVKTMAWLIGQLLWYTEAVSFSRSLFIGTIAQQGMSQGMIDVLYASVHITAPKKRQPRTPAPSTDVVALVPDVIEYNHETSQDEFDDLLGEL